MPSYFLNVSAERMLVVFRRVVAVPDLDTELLAPDAFLDLLTAIANAENDAGSAVAREQPKLMEQERLAGDLDERLGYIRHLRTEARTETTRENADGRQRGHGVSSKPKRDSRMYFGRSRASS